MENVKTQTVSPICHLPFAIFHSASRRRAFTLTEILVVLVIVVLILGMAMPVFRAITGSRSEEGASNQIAAMLGRARAEALGLQQPVGILFFLDPEGQGERMALVEFAPCGEWSQTQIYRKPDCAKKTVGGVAFYFICTNPAGISGIASAPPNTQSDSSNWRWVGGPPLQLRPDTDVETLPLGVAAQTICNGAVDTTPKRTTDGYLGTGVIMFDGSGRLTSELYGIADVGPLAVALELKPTGVNHAGYPSAPSVYLPGSAPARLGVMSQYGLVLFQRESFVSQNFSTGDVIYNTATTPPTPPSNTAWQASYGSGTPSEAQEEGWLDLNATPLIINRYNGTLVKAE